MKTADQTARERARISEPGLALNSGEFVPAEELNRLYRAHQEQYNERSVPLPWWLTADEWLQRRMPWNGLTLAAAIVLTIAVGVLLAHAWGRLG